MVVGGKDSGIQRDRLKESREIEVMDVEEQRVVAQYERRVNIKLKKWEKAMEMRST